MKKTSIEDEFFFVPGDIESKIRTVIIMGVNRSGKTTLGNLIATDSNVEHLDEPWPLFTLPILVNLKIIEPVMGKQLFLTYLKELMNDAILLRGANFRPDELSSIWLRRTPSEIFSRIAMIQNRSDVDKYINKNKPFSLLNLSESGVCNLLTITNFLPTSKIIHVVRNGVNVANQIYQKKWLSDKELINPSYAQIFRSYKYRRQTFCVPWWLKKGDEEEFIEYSEFERGLFYWCELMESAMKLLKMIKNKYIEVKYEDIISNPQKTIEDINKFLGTNPSSMTIKAIKDIEKHDRRVDSAPKISDRLFTRVSKVYRHYGYKF